ncbi:MAG: cation transporter dimerization domain-containing protein [Candidatus Kapaibacterium sp.]
MGAKRHKITGILKDKASPLFYPVLSLSASLLFSLIWIALSFIYNYPVFAAVSVIFAINAFSSYYYIEIIRFCLRSPDYSFNYGYGKYHSFAAFTSTVLYIFFMIAFAIWHILMPDNTFSEMNYIYGIAASLLFMGISNFFASKFDLLNKDYYISQYKSMSRLWKSYSYTFILMAAAQAVTLLMYGNYPAFSGKYYSLAVSLILLALPAARSFRCFPHSVRQLLDKPLPEEMNFEILSVVTENLHRICEFRAMHTRQSGKDFFIELDIMLPPDYSLEKKFEIEKIFSARIQKIIPGAYVRIYVLPCDNSCRNNDGRNCPIDILPRKKGAK